MKRTWVVADSVFLDLAPCRKPLAGLLINLGIASVCGT
jgi:hypothetical protein